MQYSVLSLVFCRLQGLYFFGCEEICRFYSIGRFSKNIYDPRDACPNLDPEHVINRECETFVSPNGTLLGHLGYMWGHWGHKILNIWCAIVHVVNPIIKMWNVDTKDITLPHEKVWSPESVCLVLLISQAGGGGDRRWVVRGISAEEEEERRRWRRWRRMVERRRWRWRSPIVRSASPLLTHQSPSCRTQANINKCKLVVTELSRAWAESLVSDEMSYMSPSCHKQATIRQCCRLSFHLERRSPQPYESGCRKCMALKKYLQDHRTSWKQLSALLCPSTWH